MATDKVVTGRLNPATGNPELLLNGKVVASAEYRSMAVLAEGSNSSNRGTQFFICLSPFWEGALPSDMIGKAIRLTPADRHIVSS